MTLTQRPAAGLMVGLSGFVVMLAMVAPHLEGMWPLLAGATLGAAAAGYAFAGFFGRMGWRGFGFFVLGAGLTTFAGAAIAGFGIGLVVFNPGAGAILGPVAVGQALLTSPPVLIVWAISMAIAQAALLWLGRQGSVAA